MKMSLKLPSRLELIPEFILKILQGLKKEIQLTDEQVFQIRLVLEESLTNAIKHGNEHNQNLTVDVAVAMEDSRLMIEVKDQGKGFDYNNIPDPTQKEKLFLTSGRGVFLIKKIMDEVNFFDSGSRIRMVKILRKNKDFVKKG